jgi:excisionase family DNA binding protein
MNAQALATYLGVTERTVRRWIADGDLPAEKRGGSFAIRRADGEKLHFGTLGGQAAEDRARLEAVLAKRDLELAELRGRYNELSDRYVRLEEDAATERRERAKAEAERDLLLSRRAA